MTREAFQYDYVHKLTAKIDGTIPMLAEGFRWIMTSHISYVVVHSREGNGLLRLGLGTGKGNYK